MGSRKWAEVNVPNKGAVRAKVAGPRLGSVHGYSGQCLFSDLGPSCQASGLGLASGVSGLFSLLPTHATVNTGLVSQCVTACAYSRVCMCVCGGRWVVSGGSVLLVPMVLF